MPIDSSLASAKSSIADLVFANAGFYDFRRMPTVRGRRYDDRALGITEEHDPVQASVIAESGALYVVFRRSICS